MKDLDFDELDKAVNSLMTNVPKTDEPPTAGREKTLDLTATASTASSMPLPSVPSSDTNSDTAMPQPTTSIPPATRRGGRFMDVVHPSSDMKNQTPSVPARPVSRQGVSVNPRPGANQPEERAAPEPTTSIAAGSPVQGIAAPDEPTPPVTQKTPPANEWPDPLEMTGFNKPADEPKKEAPTPEVSPAEAVTDTEAEKLQQGSGEEQAPLTSPFLPGTKVEKRPLGSGLSAPTEEPDHAPITGAETAKTVDDPNAQLPALPADVEPILPEELQGDMMAVESDTHMGMPKTEETHPLKEETPEPDVKEAPAPKTPPAASPPAPAKEETPSGPTSIPPQYREEPSTGDKNNGAIYDTDSYHKPLAHPGKKKSGWLWVLWIVIILLVGAGGGALLYFLGIV